MGWHKQMKMENHMKTIVSAVAVGLAFFSQAVVAQANSLAFVSVPTLDDIGLVGLTIVVALAGAIAARRKKK